MPYLETTSRLLASQIIKKQGFESIEESTLDVMADVFNQYLRSMCQSLHSCVEHSGRSAMNFDDIETTFNLNGIQIEELKRFMAHNAKIFNTSHQVLNTESPVEIKPNLLKNKNKHFDEKHSNLTPCYLPLLPNTKTWHKASITITNGII